jgi:hypothetical protein
MRQVTRWGIAAVMTMALLRPLTPQADTMVAGRSTAQAQHPGILAEASVQGTLTVTYHEGRLSVRAEHMPLVRIIQEVARQTGLEVRALSSLRQEVSVTFTALPLLDGLRRLLTRVNYLLLFERSPQGSIQPTQALVFGREATPSLGHLPREAPRPSRKRGTSEALRQAMADGDPSVRRWAVERLGERGDVQAVPHLLAALDDANPGVRQGALASLSQYGEIALEPLQVLLQREQDLTVRIVALQVLGQVGREDKETAALLHQMLKDPDPRIRAAVVEALGSVGGLRATDALHDAARDGDPEVRLAALQALSQSIHDAAAQATVGQHLDDADETVRDVAAALLETFIETPERYGDAARGSR